MTFLINAAAVAVFVAISAVSPRVTWLLIPLLLLELYVFIVGVALLLSALFVRFRDVIQVWELVATLLFYASPIMYPVGFLPPWAQPIVFANPLVQVIQAVRVAVIGVNQPNETAAAVYGTPFGALIPISVAFVVFFFGLWVFRREAPQFAERL
jgi:ABC-2 type transport system permease protein